jgi:hypothetical protein
MPGSFFFFSAEVWTQDLHLEWLTSPFLWRVFWDRVSWTICPGWLWTSILLISASRVARIAGVSQQHFFCSPPLAVLCKEAQHVPWVMLSEAMASIQGNSQLMDHTASCNCDNGAELLGSQRTCIHFPEVIIGNDTKGPPPVFHLSQHY